MAHPNMRDVLSSATASEVPAPLLRAKGPVYTGIQDCLRIQAHAVPHGWMAKLFGRCPLDAAARTSYSTALAEGAVARVLRTLSPEWTVLQAEPARSGHNVVDHMLIGPSGLYAITTIDHGGRRVIIDGESISIGRSTSDVLGRSRREAARMAQQVSVRVKTAVEVTPVVVVVTPVSMKVGAAHGVVAVLPSTEMHDWLVAQPRVHTGSALATYERVVLDQSAWKPVVRVTDDTIRHINRFDRLQQDVNSAGVRARAWSRVAMAGIVAGVGGLAAVLGTMYVSVTG
ncbi:hypothetical protein [Leifsonia sp. A12D58]|uniref:hypothetical protein n=1 Tax=Leifsonia sp. A12D58 TaxID=3397674 RepID=UPI0039E1A533